MKNIPGIFIFLIFLLSSCGDWKDMDKDWFMKQSICDGLFEGIDSIVDIRHNLDNGTLHFKIVNFTDESLLTFDKIAGDKNWCIINKISNERTYALPSKEEHINAEIIQITYVTESALAYVLIH